MHRLLPLIIATLTCLQPLAALASDERVKITRDLGSVEVVHEGKPVTVQRNQDAANTIHPKFQRTSRSCPPFCVQPMKIAEGVETIGELGMLDYLKRVSEGDDSVLVIDSRGPDWVKHGTIPGSINIHYKKLNRRSAEDDEIARLLEEFGVERSGEFWNYRWAKTLVFFCNGMWCGQSPTNIKSLLRIGYPPSKLKWYRGGMQSWETLGLTTVQPD